MKLSKTIYTLALGTLAAIVLGLGVVYATKQVYCPSVSDYRLDRTHYVGVVYEGPPQRLEQAIIDYHLGKIQFIMPSGGVGINNMKQHALELGVPESKVILPDIYSRDTFENVTTSSKAIKEKGLDNSRRHYGGEKQISRIRTIIERLKEDPEKNDGYAPVKDGYTGKLYGIWNLREAIACVKDRFLENPEDE